MPLPRRARGATTHGSAGLTASVALAPPDRRGYRAAQWACSSVVEHCVDIAGVASSILATPTIKSLGSSTSYQGFFVAERPANLGPVPRICPENLGKSPGRWANIGHADALESPVAGVRLADCRRPPIITKGAPLVRVRGGRLDGHEETSRVRVSGQRRVLGRGPVRADERVFPMSIKDPAAGAASPADAVVPPGPQAKAPKAGATRSASPKTGASPPPSVGIAAADGARAPPDPLGLAPGETYLTPQIMLARLAITSTDPAKWMRRTFKKHGVPFVHVGGKLRASEAQFRLLMDKITCSPSEPVGRTAFTISEARSLSATRGSTSKSSVQERVTQMLRRT